jgi:hypothetical protein
VVERGDLGDHPADADARQVRRPVVEFAGERRGVGCEIAQLVRRSLGIDGGRRTAVAQVVYCVGANAPPPPANTQENSLVRAAAGSPRRRFRERSAISQE